VQRAITSSGINAIISIFWSIYKNR